MIAAMTDFPLLSQRELAAFVEEGFVVLDRPLTWEILGRLLDTLSEDAEQVDAQQ